MGRRTRGHLRSVRREWERPDRWVRRRVALKIIKAGMDTAQVVARFEAERQAIARTYRSLAAYEKAERQWQVVLESARRRLGPNAPEVFRAQDSVAFMRQIAGRSDAESLALARSAAKGLARTLGPDHPDTLASRRHLGLSLMSAGRAAEAVALHEDTVKAKERVLGAVHRETLLSRADLAEAYMVVGRTAEAVALLESTLTARESTLGPDHPDALTSRSYLAAAYLHAGRAADAAALLEPVMATIETKFGFDQRVTQAARSHLTRAYQARGVDPRAVPPPAVGGGGAGGGTVPRLGQARGGRGVGPQARLGRPPGRRLRPPAEAMSRSRTPPSPGATRRPRAASTRARRTSIEAESWRSRHRWRYRLHMDR